jgi:hypothetical protein
MRDARFRPVNLGTVEHGRPWIAYLHDDAIRTKAGNIRRFATRRAALRARAKASERECAR